MMWDERIPIEFRNQIVTGDAKILAEQIPNESIGLILCDPIYWQIDDYEWVSFLATRKLVMGGSIVAQVGSEHRYDAETAMRKSGLSPLPLLAQVYDMAFRRMFEPRVMQGWKPHLWFCKSEPKARNGGWLFDRFHSHKVPSKENHEWEDNPAFFRTIVGQLTMPDEVVLDPFCGSGSVPIVCKILGRNYIAFEIEPDVAEKARQRVQNTQPPLFVLQPSQIDMGLEEIME